MRRIRQFGPGTLAKHRRPCQSTMDVDLLKVLALTWSNQSGFTPAGQGCLSNAKQVAGELNTGCCGSAGFTDNKECAMGRFPEEVRRPAAT